MTRGAGGLVGSAPSWRMFLHHQSPCSDAKVQRLGRTIGHCVLSKPVTKKSNSKNNNKIISRTDVKNIKYNNTREEVCICKYYESIYHHQRCPELRFHLQSRVYPPFMLTAK